jgi:hypothetical protein
MNKAVHLPVQQPVQRYTSKNFGIGSKSSIADAAIDVVDQQAVLMPATTADPLIDITNQPTTMLPGGGLCTHKRDTSGRYCRACRAQYMRGWRKKQRAMVMELKVASGRIVSRGTSEAT